MSNSAFMKLLSSATAINSADLIAHLVMAVDYGVSQPDVHCLPD